MPAKPVGDWFVYIVRCKDDTLYTGISTDPQAREKEHNEGRAAARYTRSRRPVRLVYTETVSCRSTALKREHAIKQLDRRDKLALIKGLKTNPRRAD